MYVNVKSYSWFYKAIISRPTLLCSWKTVNSRNMLFNIEWDTPEQFCNDFAFFPSIVISKLKYKMQMQSHFKNVSFKSYYYFIFSYYMLCVFSLPSSCCTVRFYHPSKSIITETKSTSILKEVLEIIKCFLIALLLTYLTKDSICGSFLFNKPWKLSLFLKNTKGSKQRKTIFSQEDFH